jgi:uncharacterized protein YcbK (DUF882 family)
VVRHSKICGRRPFLGWSLAAGGALLLPGTKGARAAGAAARQLRFHNLHTGESLTAVYWEGGRYVAEGLAQIDYMLRDFRTGDVYTIDPKLLDLVHQVQIVMEDDGAVDVISGYRSPATNAMLASRSDGVAKNSFHLKGMAIDLRLRKGRLEDLRAAAWSLGGGGVGYYPNSDFVHMDTGPLRTW